MSEVIQRHDFEEAKLAIKSFSEQTHTDLSLSYVQESKDVGEWLKDFLLGGGIKTEHVVTGKELNKLVERIQELFKKSNSTEIKLIQEFGQVYCALQALDKDYITWIIETIEAVQETSARIDEDNIKINALQQSHVDTLEKIADKLKTLMAFKKDVEDRELPNLCSRVSDVLATSEKNKQAIDGINQSLTDSNGDIKRLSNSLNEQIEHIQDLKAKEIDPLRDSLYSAHDSLAELRSKLETVKGITDKHQQGIDSIRGDVEGHSEKLNILTQQNKKTAEDVAQNHQAIVELNDYKQELSSIVHLKEIDTIWGNVENHSKKLEGLIESGQKTNDAVAQNQKDIAELNQGLSAIAHLNDVDNLWESNETHSEEIKALQEQGEDARKLIQQNKDLADQSLAEEKSRIDTMMQSLNKKIQYAYWVAGGSMALALIELFVILLG